MSKGDIHGQVVVLGAGPGGYSAAFRAADLGLDVVLIEKYSTLGGVCLNVGCIPSKALLHTAKIIDEAEQMSAHGVKFGKPKIDLDKIREYKDNVVGQLTKGLAGMAKMRKVKVVQGTAKFASANSFEVVGEDGKTQIVTFDNCIIAAGSRVVQLGIVEAKIC
jgi:dihydrolipoamide dehydrogenase